MQTRRFALVGLASGLVAGCGPGLEARFAEPTALAKKPGRQSFAVLSAIGDTFEMRTVGMTVFGNDQQAASMAAWRLDEHVTKTVAARLAAVGDVKALAVPPGTFDAYHRPPGALSGAPDAGLAPYERVHKAVEALTRQHAADGYLVVLKHRTPFGNTNIPVLGVGVVRGPEVLMANAFAHALIEIRYFDGARVLKNVKPATADGPSNPLMPRPLHGPHSPADPSWPKAAADLVADARVQGSVRALLDTAIATTLPQVLALGKAAG
jgi:hypothetical protein